MTKKAFQVFDITLSASQSRQILYEGTYFKVISSSGALDVTIEGQGTLPDLLAGQGLKNTSYSRLILTDASGLSNTIRIFCATEEYVDQTFSGSVSLSDQQGAFTQGRTSVGSGAAVTLMAANPARRRILVQNNTAAQNLRVTLDGSAPTAANGLRLIPGDFLDLTDYCPTGEIRAIFESGGAADVEWAEG